MIKIHALLRGTGFIIQLKVQFSFLADFPKSSSSEKLESFFLLRSLCSFFLLPVYRAHNSRCCLQELKFEFQHHHLLSWHCCYQCSCKFAYFEGASLQWEKCCQCQQQESLKVRNHPLWRFQVFFASYIY